MTKPEFFNLCASCKLSLAHQLRVYEDREFRGLDYVISLAGSTWSLGMATDQEIYHPLRGRQGYGSAPYSKARAMITKELVKYRRWLDEWKKANGYDKKPSSTKE